MNKRKFKILTVDDNIKNIQVVGSILKESDYQVGFAFNGTQAIELLSSSDDYDLVLLDVNMPGIDGYETCRRIRKNKQLKDIPVIFLTALDDTKNLVEGFEAGGQDYITKPFNTQELLMRVQTHVELKHSREQLKNANLLLEQKVAERTHQLSEANKELVKVNNELQGLDEVKADFLKLISHEINTPLNGIIGFTSILKEELANNKFYELLQYLDVSAKRLEKFAQLSLLVTEFRTKKKAIATRSLELMSIFSQVIDVLKEPIENKQIDVAFDFASDDEAVVYGEPELVRLCLERILNNSVRYSPVKGVVTISMYKEDKATSVVFSDQGKGFAEKILNAPFRLFNIGEEHLDEDKGISLALTKMIMDAHGGAIEIANNNSGGGVVKLSFPDRKE